MQAEVRDRPAEVEVEDAGLDPRDPRVRVDVEHAVHPGGDDDDRVAERGRTAREAGAAAAGDERPPVTPRDAYGGGDLVRRARPADGHRAPLAHARVASVQRELERLALAPAGPSAARRSAKSVSWCPMRAAYRDDEFARRADPVRYAGAGPVRYAASWSRAIRRGWSRAIRRELVPCDAPRAGTLTA